PKRPKLVPHFRPFSKAGASVTVDRPIDCDHHEAAPRCKFMHNVHDGLCALVAATAVADQHDRSACPLPCGSPENAWHFAPSYVQSENVFLHLMLVSR